MLERIDYNKRTEIPDTLDEHGLMITKINEIIDDLNNRQTRFGYCGGCGANMARDAGGLCSDFSTHGAGGESRPIKKDLEEIINIEPLPEEGEKWKYSQLLAHAIRTWLEEQIQICLTENDSDTHIIVKDLLEKI